ncbi:hypothetical protein EMCRGX_G018061 [Ephydatia muelleri]
MAFALDLPQTPFQFLSQLPADPQTPFPCLPSSLAGALPGLHSGPFGWGCLRQMALSPHSSLQHSCLDCAPMVSETCDFYAGDGPPLAPDKNGLGPELVCQLVVDVDYDPLTQPAFV